MFAPRSEWVQVVAAGMVMLPHSKQSGRFRAVNHSRAAFGQPASIGISLQGRANDLAERSNLRLIDVASPIVANAPLIRVFVNHPSIGPDTAPSGPHYVGTVSFFGTCAQDRTLRVLPREDGLGFSPADLCVADISRPEALPASFNLPLPRVIERLRSSG
jgi:hypothetical protein